MIDLFAGPGGLGEGFSQKRDAQGRAIFKIALSIEKEASAHRTLSLRAFFRQFEDGRAPDDYYRFLRGEITHEEMLARHPVQAKAAAEEAWLAELGADVPGDGEVRRRITAALKHAGGEKQPWVLLGGPPCQAFSLAGRARNKGKDGWSLDTDARHTLYKQYLRIIADHSPALFVMENVKGLLSASVKAGSVLEQILQDLRDPSTAFGKKGHKYRLYSVAPNGTQQCLSGDEELTPSSFIVRCEEFGVPQARHRLILVGVRRDLDQSTFGKLRRSPAASVQQAIGDLPPLRSGLSTRDSREAWRAAIEGMPERKWMLQLANSDPVVHARILEALHEATPSADRGQAFIPPDQRRANQGPGVLANWYRDRRIGGVVNHESRGHMAEDLDRYMFAACHAEVHKRSPRLEDFPRALLPKHESVKDALAGGHFNDRFRVQVAGLPATTVVSHIAKDGHYYIHYDPRQCRALTVREAARLQTFPDNYFFMGNRTEQYTQVGNAVPPYIATQIAALVADFFAGGRV